MKACTKCTGRGGMVVDDDLQIDFEVCMECDGYGSIYEESDDDN